MLQWRLVSRSLSSHVRSSKLESRRLVKIGLIEPGLPSRRRLYHPSTPTTQQHPQRRPRPQFVPMASVDDIVSRLQGLSLGAKVVKHDPVTSPAAWKDALAAASDAPASYELTKTLVYKPKTAKTATPVPVIAIVREETETSSGSLGKKLNLKELRLANEDLMKEFFSADKDSGKRFRPR